MDSHNVFDWNSLPNELKRKIVEHTDLATRFNLMKCSRSDYAVAMSSDIRTDVLTVKRTRLIFKSDETMNVVHHFKTNYNLITNNHNLQMERMRQNYNAFRRRFRYKIITKKLILYEIDESDIQFINMIKPVITQAIEVHPGTIESFRTGMKFVATTKFPPIVDIVKNFDYLESAELWNVSVLSVRHIIHFFKDEHMDRWKNLRTIGITYKQRLTHIGLAYFIKNWLNNPKPEEYYFLLGQNLSCFQGALFDFNRRGEPDYREFLRQFNNVKIIRCHHVICFVKNKKEIGVLEVVPYARNRNIEQSHWVKFRTMDPESYIAALHSRYTEMNKGKRDKARRSSSK